MAHTMTPTSDAAADIDDVARVLDEEGQRHTDERLDPWLADLDIPILQTLYRDMVLVRRIDAEGVALQRQGQLGLWAPCRGQEGVQVGTAHALRSDDFVFPSYREHGVLHVRGATPEAHVLSWRGEAHSAFDPFTLNTATPQIIIGAQTLHAVGYAMGIQRDAALKPQTRADQVAVTYFGDGATSQGDVSEAMVFASSFHAPVVFVCSNNQWAISEPVAVQSAFPIAGRAPGFGIPSIRIDGNDALASLAAMRWALERARRGDGPSFIEAVTYRMGPHTTSDDPTRYRDDAEVQRWARRDPIVRMESLLHSLDACGDEFLADVAADADRRAAEVRAACLGAHRRAPIEVLDDVYAEPHTGIDEQRAHFGAYLDGFADDGAEVGR